MTIQSNLSSNLHNSPFYISLEPVNGANRIKSADTILIRYGVQSRHANQSSDIHIGLQPLGNNHLVECWQMQSPLRHSAWNNIHYSQNDEMLFGILRISETDERRINSLTLQIYRKIEALRRQLGFPHLLRMWNYFADINAPADNGTRYQEFCQGRHTALQDDPEFISHLPAATVIGTHNPGYVIYFIAAREPGIPVANPRQINPYEYPRQYGSNSPSFVRALVKHWPERNDLYVSGTASIVGHESQHTGDTLKQLDETLRNLDALIVRAGREQSLTIRDTAELTHLKIYLRHQRDYDVVRQRLQERLGPDIPCLYLHGEICRNDLLVEIEGMYLDG